MQNLKRNALVTLFAFELAGAAVLDAALVTDIKACQRWPWNSKVDIDFTLSSTQEAPIFGVSFYGEQGGGKSFALSGLSGAGAQGVIEGAGTYRTTWDAGNQKEVQGARFSDFRVGVEVTEREPFPNYVKVNLQDGSVATQDTAPESWSDEDKSTYLWLKKVEPGTFTMGAESQREDGNPPHQVTISKTYYLGVFEVTRDQYVLVANTYLHGTFDFPSGNGFYPANEVSYNDLRGATTGALWPSSATSPNHGVDNASFFGILRRKVLAKSGKDYQFDLPTDAQWEYACRAGHEGDKWNDGTAEGTDNYPGALAWYGPNSGFSTHPVGEKKPNSWGFYDMHGNVQEWCLDWFGKLGEEAVTDPVGALEDSSRIARGGGFGSNAGACRSANRNFYVPTGRLATYGLRVTAVPY